LEQQAGGSLVRRGQQRGQHIAVRRAAGCQSEVGDQARQAALQLRVVAGVEELAGSPDPLPERERVQGGVGTCRAHSREEGLDEIVVGGGRGGRGRERGDARGEEGTAVHVVCFGIGGGGVGNISGKT